MLRTAFNSLGEGESMANLNDVYPVGSLFFSTASVCPLQSLISGSVWSKVGTSLALNVNTKVPVKGNGKTVVWTDGKKIFGTKDSYGVWDSFTPCANMGNIGADGGSNVRTEKSSAQVGITTDASKSGIVGTVTRTQLTINIFQRTA